jgi:excisionase family DNA binding protein
MASQVFTTFDVAKLCGVFHTTVINWANKGKIKAYVTPGGHRRILLKDLVDFMTRFDIPVPEDLSRLCKKVLIVDDDASVQRMILRALAPLLPNIETKCCSSGLEALMIIGKESPDLLVLDIRIPQVNGLEVCKLLRTYEQTKPIKIIAITGEALLPEDKSYLKSHVDAFFQKPLPTAEIREKVRGLLELEESPARTR